MQLVKAREYIHRFEAVLFDLDGTLIDTMPLHYRAYSEVLARRSVTLSHALFMSAIGAPAREAIPRFLAAAGVCGASSEEISAIHIDKKLVFKRLIKEGCIQPLPAAALLEEALGKKRLGLVSSGNRDGIMALLSAMRWIDFFDIIISGDDVLRGKPNPEPYLTAAAALRVSPENCIVLEDTEAGLTSGRAAGMTVLDVAEFTVLE